MKEKNGLDGLLGGVLGIGMLMDGDNPLGGIMGLMPGMGLLSGMASDDEAEKLLDGKTPSEMIEVTRKEFEKAEAHLEEYRKAVEQIMEQKRKLDETLNQESPEAKANRSAIEDAALSILRGIQKAYPDFFSFLEEKLKEKSERLAKAKQFFDKTEPMMRGLAEEVERREKLFEQMQKEDKKNEEKAASLLSKTLFKPGDKVRISNDPVRPDDRPCFVKGMEAYKGKVATIESVCPGYSVSSREATYHLVECEGHWAERWLEPVDKKQPKKLSAPKKST